MHIDQLYTHGGFFKTPKVGLSLLSAAVDAPVSVMKTTGEGVPYGTALLAAVRHGTYSRTPILQRDRRHGICIVLDGKEELPLRVKKKGRRSLRSSRSDTASPHRRH